MNCSITYYRYYVLGIIHEYRFPPLHQTPIGIPGSWTNKVARSFTGSDWQIAMIWIRWVRYFLAVVPWLHFCVAGLACLASAGANVVIRRCSTWCATLLCLVWNCVTIAATEIESVARSTIKHVCTFVVLVLGLRSVEHISCTTASKSHHVRTLGATVKHDMPVVECDRQNAIRTPLVAR